MVCTDTGCNLEDRLEVMDDRDKWQERERELGKSVLMAQHNDDEDWWKIFIDFMTLDKIPNQWL